MSTGHPLCVMRGHTETMMLPQINYNGRTVFFCADLLPSAAHTSLPWVMAYDMRPLDTLNEKTRIFKEAVANDWVLFLEHDPTIECVTLQQTDKGIKQKDVFRLSELG